ncbi:hypothetical protein AS159_00685 [Thermotoga sp. Ku-13t]|uniref:hypothetical protein n=1 Tax=Thermotoga sp. Ku-13t TaxID=1755813 RepID=UPI0013EDA707|nr:hypothetical protein [Thermotoga sp. Ku-13t]KAF2958266.1 hypothetical protein AS159_00685 [Thermotoga sp. Ku-13t]
MKERLSLTVWSLLVFCLLSPSYSLVGQSSWQRTSGGPNIDYARDVVVDENGSFLIDGGTSSYSAGGSDICTVKINKKGNKIWEKTFDGTKDEFVYAVVAVENGFIVAGGTKSILGKNRQAHLIRLDSQSNVLWQASTS